MGGRGAVATDRGNSRRYVAGADVVAAQPGLAALRSDRLGYDTRLGRLARVIVLVFMACASRAVVPTCVPVTLTPQITMGVCETSGGEIVRSWLARRDHPYDTASRFMCQRGMMDA